MRPCRRPEVPWRIIDGEAIVVNPRAGLVYPLNAVATRCWELADGTRSLADMTAVLLDEFETTREQTERDLGPFVAELVKKGLLEMREVTAVRSEAADERV